MNGMTKVPPLHIKVQSLDIGKKTLFFFLRARLTCTLSLSFLLSVITCHLTLAAGNGHVQVLQWLVENGANCK